MIDPHEHFKWANRAICFTWTLIATWAFYRAIVLAIWGIIYAPRSLL